MRSPGGIEGSACANEEAATAGDSSRLQVRSSASIRDATRPSSSVSPAQASARKDALSASGRSSARFRISLIAPHSSGVTISLRAGVRVGAEPARTSGRGERASQGLLLGLARLREPPGHPQASQARRPPLDLDLVDLEALPDLRAVKRAGLLPGAPADALETEPLGRGQVGAAGEDMATDLPVQEEGGRAERPDPGQRGLVGRFRPFHGSLLRQERAGNSHGGSTFSAPYAPAPGPATSSSRRSQARAVRHSRLTVAVETPAASAVSSTDSPPKNRSSTIRA